MKMKTEAEVKVVPNGFAEREAAVVIEELRENLKQREKRIEQLEQRIEVLQEALSRKLSSGLDFEGKMG